jgi:signal transduction histidine kinase
MDIDKDRFIHDLRNPLNTISMNAELGKLTLERTGDIRKAISIFEIIIAESHQCSRVLEELKAIRFIKPDEGDE